MSDFLLKQFLTVVPDLLKYLTYRSKNQLKCQLSELLFIRKFRFAYFHEEKSLAADDAGRGIHFM